MRTTALLVAIAASVSSLPAFAEPKAGAVPAAPGLPAEPAARVLPGGTAGAKPQPASVDPNDVPLAGYKAQAVHVPSAPEAWGGIRDGKATLSDRVVTYQIDARLDPVKHTIDGNEKLTWKNRSAVPIKSVYFHLYLNGFEGGGSTFLREMGPADFRGLNQSKLKKGQWGYVDLKEVKQGGKEVRVSFVHPDGGEETDHTVARLDLPEAVAPGATTTLDIKFLSQLPRIIARTGWFGSYHLAGQWYPKIGVLEVPGERGATSPRWNCHEFHLNSEFFADFGSYDVKITAPKAFTVGSTGKLQSAPSAAGDDLVHHYKQDDVHDFAWTAYDGYAKPLVAEWTHAGSPKVEVKVLYPAEYEAVAQPTLKATTDALTYFSDTLGAYPYETVTAVIPPWGAEESGGMEYPTFFTNIGARTYTPDLPVVDFVAIHEFGHGYFYGILASNEFEEPFLDEGLNEFWDTRMMESTGRKFRLSLPKIGRIRNLPEIGWAQTERLGGSSKAPADPIGENAWHRLSGIGYIYAGTAVWFHDLEARLGKDVLARAFKEYYRRWKFRHPSAADLRQVLEEVSGEPKTIDDFFDEHVFVQRGLDDRVVKIESNEVLPLVGSGVKDGQRTELDVEARDKQVKEAREAFKKAAGDKKPSEKEPGPFPFLTTVTVRRYLSHLPQTLVVKFADGTEEKLDWPVGEAWKKFLFTTKTKAVSAQLDPEGKLHADPNKLDDGRTLEAAPLAARRWTLEIGHWVELGLAALGAL